MTEQTTNQPAYEPEKATKMLGAMLIAQADLLQSMQILSPAGAANGITGELAHHLRSVGTFMCATNAGVVIHDRSFAFAAALVASSTSFNALDRMAVNVPGALEACEEQTINIIRGAMPDIVGGNAAVAESLTETISPLLEPWLLSI